MKWIIIAITITYLWINIPTFHDGLFNVIDNVQVTRVEAMYRELQSGQFPVRYIDAFGHGAGSMLLKFYSPIVYYIGALFHMTGFTVIQSVKLVYLAMTALGTVGIFVLLKSQVKSKMALGLGTLSFLTAPYLYHDFFHRGSLTEASAFMLVPWVWWAYMRIKQEVSTRNIAYGALSLAAVILTHSLTGVMVVGTIIILALVAPRSKNNLIGILLAIVFAFGLSSFSLIPALTEKNIIQYENNSLVQEGYLDHPVTFTEQFVGKNTDKTAYLGFALMVTYIMLVIMFAKSHNFRKNYGQLAIFVLIIGTGGLILMDPMSEKIWENIIYLRYFQFPFRLLTVVTTALVLGFAILVDQFSKSKMMTLTMILLILIPTLISRKYYEPLGYQYGTKYTVDDPCMTNTWADEYLSKWTSKCLLQPLPILVTPLSADVEVKNIDVFENGRIIRFNVVGTGDIQIAKYYFPEWTATNENGIELPTEPYGEHGLIKISVENELTRVSVKMEPSPGSKIGDILSLISLISVACLLAYSQNRTQSSK